MNKPEKPTFFQARQWGIAELTDQKMGDHFDVDFILEQRLNLTAVELLTRYQQSMAMNDWQQFQSDIAKLLAGMPPQYVIGRTSFYELPIKVNQATLIPRVETAELVEWILTDNKNDPKSVLDIGTGSGAIAIALKVNRQNWSMLASDISATALNIAEENAINNQVNINFVQSDVFTSIEERFDIIVSNPPYIDVAEKPLMDQRVLEFEPETALFALDNGLAIYQQIIDNLAEHLTQNGQLYLEIGFKQGDAVAKMLRQKFPTAQIEVRKDVADKPRMIRMKMGR
ncbi:peptide chain release factor N(5)-glutamine methyltransferase [Lentilactobacillus senioris]|uniref:peptide chain release factor N(5)-glutamine methyltransferase n=1 Tax=Lentilactobacillus senioris TaxID=931534 RepID=UPI002281A01D|nr:peptide chain release factor N(5)-glutamine methyltransferase [Lentilactobacillus senioris]MCY9807259.1 peptide chain release factor N(5)-glutamine methyltransferase [Lentilactobacillus senioris]